MLGPPVKVWRLTGAGGAAAAALAPKPMTAQAAATVRATPPGMTRAAVLRGRATGTPDSGRLLMDKRSTLPWLSTLDDQSISAVAGGPTGSPGTATTLFTTAAESHGRRLRHACGFAVVAVACAAALQ